MIIFQNCDDRNVLLRFKALKKYSQARIIRGSGVDLLDFPFLPEPAWSKGVVVMASRLLRDKGVYEFVEAARLLRDRGVAVEMRLIGDRDAGNLSSVSKQTLAQWTEEGFVKILGFRSDIAMQYAAANVVCLPSYREGLPKKSS